MQVLDSMKLVPRSMLKTVDLVKKMTGTDSTQQPLLQHLQLLVRGGGSYSAKEVHWETDEQYLLRHSIYFQA